MSYQDIQLNGVSPPAKVNSPTALSAGVFQINTAVSSFKRLVNTLGTPKDTPQLREKLHKTRQHIGQLVKETSEKLKEASKADHSTQVSATKKIEDAKLARDFQEVLKEYSRVQRTAAEREVAYVPFVPQTVLPSSYTASELSLSSQESQEERAVLIEQRRQDVLRLDNEVVFNEAIIQEREEGIREIQQQIGEVHEMFQDLAVLVREQGVVIDDIDSNIERSHSSTQEANRQLLRAARNQKSGASLTCLLLVLFGVLLMVLIMVFVA